MIVHQIVEWSSIEWESHQSWPMFFVDRQCLNYDIQLDDNCYELFQGDSFGIFSSMNFNWNGMEILASLRENSTNGGSTRIVTFRKRRSGRSHLTMSLFMKKLYSDSATFRLELFKSLDFVRALVSPIFCRSVGLLMVVRFRFITINV